MAGDSLYIKIGPVSLQIMDLDSRLNFKFPGRIKGAKSGQINNSFARFKNT
jgi:hypothetical protein